MIKRILHYFLRGLLVCVPTGLTILILLYVFRVLDGIFRDLFKLELFPGLGLILGLATTFILVSLVGFLASNFIGRTLLSLVDRIFTRVPVVKMLYSSLKDLVEAFAGDKKKFDKPVLVTLGPGCDAKALGFITRESLQNLGLQDHLAVYFPQSYNFAGNLLIFPKNAVTPLDITSAEAMTFIVSGGLAGAAVVAPHLQETKQPD